MDIRRIRLTKVLCVIFLFGVIGRIQDVLADTPRTVGVIKRDPGALDGYNLYKPLGGAEVFLINNAGNSVHKWTIPAELLPPPEGVRPGGEVFLRKNGELVLTADWGIAAIDGSSNIVWKIDSRNLKSGRWFGHHEVVELPNGNMLLPGYIEKTRDEAEAAGFPVAAADACSNTNPAIPKLKTLRVDNIWEMAPNNPALGFKAGWKIVWRWNTWDHITTDVTAQRNRADIRYIDPAEGICGNYIQGAWTFGRYNALGFNPVRNEIVMSASLQNEIRIISHRISTEIAKGPLGDFRYRWGNPYAYGAGRPFVNKDDRGDQKLSFQHRVQWIPHGIPGSGNLLIFDNGTDWGDSSVIEIRPPIGMVGNYVQPFPGEAFGPKAVVWRYDEYDTPGSFSADFISSAQRLANGNTLVNNGPLGYFFEVTPSGDKVWEYYNPTAGVSQGGLSFPVYRLWRYAPDFPGLSRLSLKPKDPLEFYPYEYDVDFMPGSCQNTLGSRGLVSVAILGSSALDVVSIDPRTVLVEGFAPLSWAIRDVSAPGRCYGGRDGYPDLIVYLNSSSLAPRPGKPSYGAPGGRVTLRLTGYSTDWFLGKGEALLVK